MGSILSANPPCALYTGLSCAKPCRTYRLKGIFSPQLDLLDLSALAYACIHTADIHSVDAIFSIFPKAGQEFVTSLLLSLIAGAGSTRCSFSTGISLHNCSVDIHSVDAVFSIFLKAGQDFVTSLLHSLIAGAESTRCSFSTGILSHNCSQAAEAYASMASGLAQSAVRLSGMHLHQLLQHDIRLQAKPGLVSPVTVKPPLPPFRI